MDRDTNVPSMTHHIGVASLPPTRTGFGARQRAPPSVDGPVDGSARSSSGGRRRSSLMGTVSTWTTCVPDPREFLEAAGDAFNLVNPSEGAAASAPGWSPCPRAPWGLAPRVPTCGPAAMGVAQPMHPLSGYRTEGPSVPAGTGSDPLDEESTGVLSVDVDFDLTGFGSAHESSSRNRRDLCRERPRSSPPQRTCTRTIGGGSRRFGARAVRTRASKNPVL